ncbi:MAG: FAD binding domain-containing protein [Actinomycetota bacterium]
MTAPELAEPTSVPQACDLLAGRPDDAKVIAGGTAVVLMMRQRLISPGLLVSLDRIAGLDRIAVLDGHLTIGASATLSEVTASEVVRRHAPALARACGLVANVRVRNAATLGGNLAEADYASDPPAMLSCLGASCVVDGPEGRREVRVAELITGFYSTVLSPAEIITEIRVPIASDGQSSTYLKYNSRSSEDRPCVGVAASLVTRNEVISDLRIAVGAVASAPVVLPDVCRRAAGRTLDEDTIDLLADSYSGSIEPMDDARGSAWYRTEMIRVFVHRALQDLSSPVEP